ncbi:MAG: hypothetical protein IID33_09340 [Planctomycetes bacterium]|nr:hypothetical protein [Planctomycetota bacterium]
MSEQAESKHAPQTLLGRARFVVALALVWGALHYVCEASVVPRGLDRALVVTGAENAILAPLLTGALLLAVAYFAAVIAGTRRAATAPLIVGLALACWSAPAGTMDDWLKLKVTTRDGSASAAYWPLIAEYIFLLFCMIGAMVLGELASLGGSVSDPAKRKSALRRALGLDLSAAEIRNGLLAMLVTAVVAGVLLLYLNGPRVGHTHRGQVYFAVAVAFLCGALVASKIVGTQHPLWYGLSPFLVGITGVILAGINPALPGSYANINVIPASGLVRALPIELVGVATVTVIWALRPGQSSSASPQPG